MQPNGRISPVHSNHFETIDPWLEGGIGNVSIDARKNVTQLAWRYTADRIYSPPFCPAATDHASDWPYMKKILYTIPIRTIWLSSRHTNWSFTVSDMQCSGERDGRALQLPFLRKRRLSFLRALFWWRWSGLRWPLGSPPSLSLLCGSTSPGIGTLQSYHTQYTNLAFPFVEHLPITFTWELQPTYKRLIWAISSSLYL